MQCYPGWQQNESFTSRCRRGSPPANPIRGRQGQAEPRPAFRTAHLTVCNCTITLFHGNIKQTLSLKRCCSSRPGRALAISVVCTIATWRLWASRFSQFSILRLLKEHEQLKIIELAEIMIMERTSLVRALKPLQVSGWVVAERADDGRAFDLTLSPSGMVKVGEAIPLWAEAQAAFEGEVGRERATRLRKVIWELNLGA